MLMAEWDKSIGWSVPEIVPYQNLSLDPATCVFHYGFECFEGMKAYRATDGSARLFRPDKNMERLNKSAARIALPTFDNNQLLELTKALVKLEDRFIPRYVASRALSCQSGTTRAPNGCHAGSVAFLSIFGQSSSAPNAAWELDPLVRPFFTSSLHLWGRTIRLVSRPSRWRRPAMLCEHGLAGWPI